VLTLDDALMWPVWAVADEAHYWMTADNSQPEWTGIPPSSEDRTYLLMANYPVAGTPTVVDSALLDDVSFRMVASTPKRIVWNVAEGLKPGVPFDGVRVLCKTGLH